MVFSQRSESPPPVMQPKVEQAARPPSRQETADNQAEWVPGGEDTIATESLSEADTHAKDEQRSPLKRLAYKFILQTKLCSCSPYPAGTYFKQFGGLLLDLMIL